MRGRPVQLLEHKMEIQAAAKLPGYIQDIDSLIENTSEQVPIKLIGSEWSTHLNLFLGNAGG